jgi:hypothetical protein
MSHGKKKAPAETRGLLGVREDKHVCIARTDAARQDMRQFQVLTPWAGVSDFRETFSRGACSPKMGMVCICERGNSQPDADGCNPLERPLPGRV